MSSWSSSSRLLPTSWPWALRKVKTMPPPMSSLSALLQQVVDDAELVGDLRAAEHHDVRALRVDGEPAQHVDLGRHQATHRRAAAAGPRRRRWPACGGRRRSRRRRRRRRAAASWSANAPRTASSLLVSPALKRTFSSSATSPSCEGRDRLGWRVSPTVSVANATSSARAARRGGRPPGPGEYAGSGSPLGRPRWAVTTTRAPASAELPDGRHARADPAVVGDRAAVERHVEVGADQDALARQVAQVVEASTYARHVRASRRCG